VRKLKLSEPVHSRTALMTFAATFAGFGAKLGGFARSRAAVSAVEFAIILPVMLLLYIGGVELGDGLAIQFKATLAARTVTDLASQYVSIDTGTVGNILNASSAVIAPYSNANMVVILSEVTTNATSQGSITWSCALNGAAHTIGQPVTLPSGLQSPSTSLLWGEVTYPYQPQFGYVITNTISIYQTSYFYPRMSNSVSGPASC